jgi:3-oxoacyl-[acyl-carrier-protein] synthase-3
MIGIRGIGTHLPEARIDLVARAAEFGSNEAFIRDKSGFVAVRRMAEGDEASDLCVAAFAALTARTGLDPAQVDCAVVVTQNPDGFGLPHAAAVVHGKLGLPETCAAFDISLGCSGYVHGLSLMRAFMEANGLKNGVLFTADPYSKIMAPDDKSTQMLFGDGAAATWLGEDPDFEIGPARFGTRGAEGGALAVGPDRRLTMNGRGVFAFSATTVPPFLKGFLADHGLALGDLDLILLHQGSKFIVDTLRTRLGATEAQVPFGAAETGNLVSSSLAFLLADHYEALRGTAVLCGFGVGLSWGAVVLRNARG